MARQILAIALLLTQACALLTAPSSQYGRRTIPGAFIYEFADGVDHDSFDQTLGLRGKVRMRFDHDLFRGASVQIKDAQNATHQAFQIAQAPNVKNIWPVYYYERPKVNFTSLGNNGSSAVLASRGGSKDVFGPHVMLQVDKLRAKGITGKGIKIAVIDSGVDYTHPALGGCFGSGCLVSFGYDLVGDMYTGENEAMPDSDPMDCESHGTQVTGIIAAQPNEYGFTGVAPGATIGSYKVFGCTGGVSTDVLIAATSRAVDDGADIITSSIGADSGWTVDAWSLLLSRISQDKGIPCTVAAGNSGSQGAFFPSDASNGPGVDAIASFDNTQTTNILTTATYSVNQTAATIFGYSPGEPRAWKGVNLPLFAFSLNSSVPDDGCTAFPDSTPDLSGYIVLLRRAGCTSTQKAKNAAAKGAKYIMFYNNAPGAVGVSLTSVKQILATGVVPPETGDAWIASLAAGKKVTLQMGDPATAPPYVYVYENTDSGGAVSTFSSWGPTMEMNFKPQFGAPGGNILSTLPRNFGYYGLSSGTSLSTPMVAGVIALIGEARGTLDPALMRNLLSSNANPQLFNDGFSFFEYLAPVAQQGSGLIQAYDAAYATTLLEPASFAFNDTERLRRQLTFRVTNKSPNTITYRFSNVPAVTIYTLGQDSIFPSTFPNEAVAGAPASLVFSAQEVSLGPGASKSIAVKAIPPTNVDVKRLALWSGYIAINGTDGSSLLLPYQGLAGTIRKAVTLATDATWIANSTDEGNTPLDPNTVFELPPPGTAQMLDGVPQLVANLALGSSSVIIEVVSLATNATKVIGQFSGSPFKWLTRGVVTFPWDGQLSGQTYAPCGDYKLVCRALRIAGNPARKVDWDVSESSSFIIRYRSSQ